MAEHEVIIIGGGPAGMAAGLYTSRAGLSSLLIERGILGGQMVNATLIENYPGFPEGISGFELATFMHQQATRYGLEILNAEVTKVMPDLPHRVLTTDGNFESQAVIIAAGSEYSRLNVPGEGKLLGRGVSYCATCDGFLFRDQRVAVVGGSDTAITDALELSHHVKTVSVIHRRDQLRAGQLLRERAFAEPKIEFIWSTVVEEILGDDRVTALRLRNVKTDQQSTLDIDGAFIAVGIKPNSQYFSDLVDTTETGHIVVDGLMASSTSGIFVAGDVRSNSARQISTAVGDGATAAISVLKYLQG